jgi:predicted metal-dependent HD superfamily phosphohydrolase
MLRQESRNHEMNARERLSDDWRDLAGRLACLGPGIETVLDELVRAYSEPHRHYHTTEHIASLLRLMDEHGQGVIDRDAMVLAMLFHDVVYDPARHDNEQASADLADERLTALAFPGQLVAKVKSYILASQHALGPPRIADTDLALLLDLDLSILAAAPAEYRAYAQAIRREYNHVPDATYRLGRRRILEGFLTRSPIYRTKQLHVLWDKQARANILGEIAALL